MWAEGDAEQPGGMACSGCWDDPAGCECGDLGPAAAAAAGNGQVAS